MQNAPEGPHEDSHESAHGRFDSAHENGQFSHVLFSHVFLRRGIGVGVKGVTGSDAIVVQYLRNSPIMFNYCTIVAPRNPHKQGELLGNQLFMGTIAFPFVNSYVAFCELLRLFP